MFALFCGPFRGCARFEQRSTIVAIDTPDVSFATFTVQESKDLTQRWRPVLQAVDLGASVTNGDALRRYTRAKMALNREPMKKNFGICALSSDGHMTLFILSREGREDTVRAVLWMNGDQEHDRYATTRALRMFHMKLFGTSTALVPGKDLEWVDRKRF